MNAVAPTRHPATAFTLPASLLIALDQEVHRTHNLAEPADTIRAVTVFLDAMTDELRRFATIRRHALNTMRTAGTSYDHIATRTGLSKSRIAQLARTLPTQPAD